jgi:hypothetical protein
LAWIRSAITTGFVGIYSKLCLTCIHHAFAFA